MPKAVLPTTADNLSENLALMPPSFLRDALTLARESLRPTVASELVFTDDLAPIELITNQIVIEYLLAGGAETLAGPME